MTDLVIEYLESEKQISSISQARDDFREKKEKEITDLTLDYEPKIRALEDERDERVAEIRKESESKRFESDEKITELHKTIEKVERILSFLKPTWRSAEWLDFDEGTVKAYRDRYCEKIGTFYRDEYLKIVAYIAENSKPKNKYSLTLVGKCFFGEKQMPFPYAYGLDLAIFGEGFTVAVPVIDKPTIEEAKAYFTKNREKILKPTMEKYQEVKKEYLDVIRTYTIDDFGNLIAYRCSECGFFYTEREARHISRIEESSCPNCEKGNVRKVLRREKKA